MTKPHRILSLSFLTALMAGVVGYLVLGLATEPVVSNLVVRPAGDRVGGPALNEKPPGPRHRLDQATRNRDRLRREFNGFLARTRLSSAQIERFLDLVIAEGNLLSERRARIQSGEIKTLQDANAFMRPQVEAFEQQIRDLIGEGAFQEYRTAKQRIPIERDLSLYAAIASRHGATFSEPELALVVDSTLEAYLAYGAHPQLLLSESLASDAAYQREVEARQHAFAQTMRQVAPLLNPSQRVALQKYQDQQIAGWKARRFGGR